MSQDNTLDAKNKKMLVIAVAIIAVTVLLLYMRDRQQQRDLQLRRLEARVEVLEEWGGRQMYQGQDPRQW
ncbi:MAG TPA: hypothetical protein VMW23_02645 [Sedimentisphaerales bacterium]|nr:hypothetical protein [Sedimentisphaerales bacterium]